MRYACICIAVSLFVVPSPDVVAGDAPPAAAAGGRAFEVRLDRPFVAGRSHRLTLAYASNVELLITGMRRAAEGHEARSVELAAVAEVQAVNDRGSPTKVRMVVERGSFSWKTGKSEDLRAGDVLVATVSKNGRLTVVREGVALSEEAAMLFVEALPYNNTLLVEKSEPSSFGSMARRRVGESWPLENALLGEMIPRRILLDRSALTGTMTLTNVVKFRDVPCLKVRVQSKVPHYKPADGTVGGVVPRGFKFTDGSLVTDVTAYYPLDAARQPMRYVETIRATATAEPDNHKGQATAATHNVRTVDVAEMP